MNKDTDSAEFAFKVRAGMFGVIIAGMCTAGGAVLAFHAGVSIWISMAVGIVLGIVVYYMALAISERAGTMGASIFSPRGTSTPPVREYSLADSLAARGMLMEAAEAYELLAEDHPDDPEPCVRRARLLRDRMARPDEAADWFRKALAAKDLNAASEAALLKEICELYMYKIGSASKALPYLARLAQKHPSHPSAKWAKAQALEIKQAMRDEMND